MQDVIQISSEAAVALVIGYFVTVYTFGRVLLGQFEHRAAERAQSADELRTVEALASAKEMAELRTMVVAEGRRIGTLSENMHQFTSALPLEYVRREDYIMGQTIIVAKLDAIANELKFVQIQGARNGTRHAN